ncbi:unnamed protein product [Ilex paraguariensis]|uniref:Triacylglycerol lipase n=1 Tax=Ilex paraguariensis TaxID=185542 RepID=A0ABC8V189_9AQUA
MNHSLGFMLADHDVDVWVGNVCGTRWSHGHISLSEKDKGTILSLAAFTQPEMVKMVEAAALLCPISYLDHITAQFPLRLVKIRVDKVIRALGIHELNFKSNLLTGLMVKQSVVIKSHLFFTTFLHEPHPLTTQFYFAGKNYCFNNSRVDIYLEYEPQPSSSKNLNHLFQMILKGTFAKYDFGKLRNMMKYGQLKPPVFDLSHIPDSLPLWLGYGGLDALADVNNVERTLKELQSKPELLYLENYAHLDFLLSVRANEDVYDHMIRFFKSLGKVRSS